MLSELNQACTSKSTQPSKCYSYPLPDLTDNPWSKSSEAGRNCLPEKWDCSHLFPAKKLAPLYPRTSSSRDKYLTIACVDGKLRSPLPSMNSLSRHCIYIVHAAVRLDYYSGDNEKVIALHLSPALPVDGVSVDTNDWIMYIVNIRVTRKPAPLSLPKCKNGSFSRLYLLH